MQQFVVYELFYVKSTVKAYQNMNIVFFSSSIYFGIVNCTFLVRKEAIIGSECGSGEKSREETQ